MTLGPMHIPRSYIKPLGIVHQSSQNSGLGSEALLSVGVEEGTEPCIDRGPKDYINIRILQTMISGIPLILGLGTRMSDPYVYVVLWAPN